jgi:Cdc6-like AAA superfamily ATPase
MLASIAAGGLSNAFPPSGIAFNAFNYMINAAENVSASYDSVCELLEELAQFTTRLTVHTRQEITPELRGIVIEILCAMIRLCGYAGRLMRHGRVTEYFKKVYLGKDRDIVNEIAILRRLTDTEARMVGVLTLSTTTRTEKQVNSAVSVLAGVNTIVQDTNAGMYQLRDQMSSLVIKMNETKNENRNDVEEKQLNKIRLALSPSITPEEIYRGISGKRVPGTGDWIHDERLFKAWLEHEKPILWISGGPGAGKSYLSSNIIQLLTQLHPQQVQASSRVSVAYYFCKDYDPALRSFNKALRTLAFQICQNDPVFAKYVAGVCSFPEDIKSTESLWQKLFVDYYSSEDPQSMVYMLIDGMDEAFEQERATFLELMRSLQQASVSAGKIRIQILMLGRPELSYDIEQALDENLPTISVSAIKNAFDIQSYVNTKVSKERNLRRISPGLRQEIVTELTNRADGMFLWVDLMLKEVASKHKEIQMRQALQEAPKGLFETIQHTLNRTREGLSEEDAEDFENLLSWVASAKRPFRLGELEDILKLTSKDGEGVVYLEGELRKRYASFFNVNREDGRTTEDFQAERLVLTAGEDEPSLSAGEVAVELVDRDLGVVEDFGEAMDIDSNPQTTEVTLSHASIGDFFRQHRSAEGSGTDWSMWNLRIVKHLLRMLCDKKVLEQWQNKSISGYASCYWQDHLCEVDMDSITEAERVDVAHSLVQMFQDEDTLMTWGRFATNAGLFRQSWIFTDENMIVLHQWLKGPSAQVADEERHKILKVLMDCLGKRWLQTSTLGYPEYSFMVIKAYQDKVSSLS